jgi:ATP-dependent Clp protease ATP-binding subunit ClpB
MNELHGSFRPEFLNRLDEIILFKPLTKENISNIMDLLIQDLNRRLADREIKIALTKEAKDFIADMAFDPSYGARPLKRYLQKHVETLSARLILSDQLHAEDRIWIDLIDGNLTASVRNLQS